MQSRAAAFRITFIQRFIDTPLDENWSLAASIIKKKNEGLDLDKSMHWMKPKKMPVFKLPIYCCNLFKVWSLFKVLRCGNTDSLYWTLQEPLIFGSQFDVSNDFFIIF